MDPTIQCLRDLVAIDSVNPLLAPGSPGELVIARAVADELRTIGLAVELEDAVPGRPNVVGVLEGRAPGRTLMLCGHLDTVGVQGMTAPFDPVIRDGRLYGRGAQDMKGGLAAMLGAAREIVASGGLARGRLILAAVIDEEYASAGADALVTRWRADGAVVPEPTDLAIAIAHKGFEWIEVATEGRTAHGSRPADGRDAILRMGRLLGRLEALDNALQARPPHSLLGVASLHASLIEGGRELSCYPDRCVLKMERRTLPAETAASVVAEVTSIVDDLHAEDPEFRASVERMFGRPAYELASGNELAQLLSGVLADEGRSPRTAGMSFWTDAAILGQAGIPTVLFGPTGAGLHSTEEYVVVEDVITCRRALVGLVRAFC